MKQKRKVKSLLPKKNFVNGRFLTILLVVLSLVLCVWWVSLLTHSVLAQQWWEGIGTVKINRIGGPYGSGSWYIMTGFVWSGFEYNESLFCYLPVTVTGIFMQGSQTKNAYYIEDKYYINIKTEYTWALLSEFTPCRPLKKTFCAGRAYSINMEEMPECLLEFYNPDPKMLTGDSIEGSLTFHVKYNPKNDENENGVADELEYTVVYKYEDKSGLGNVGSTTGYCEKKGDVIEFSGPEIDWYIPKVNWEGIGTNWNIWTCKWVIWQKITVEYSPIKDQNNDGIWDGAQELWEITEFDYTWLDNRVEVLYGMRFLDPSDFTKIVNSIYMSGSTLYISPNPVIVNSSNNTVDTGVYSHILWWENNEVYSNNITLIAWSNNKIHSWNDNASVLWWNGNEVMPWKSGWIPTILVGWESNVMGTGHDGNALIWWSNNTIWPIEDPYADADEVSDSIVLWWERNAIGIDSYNVIIWWKKVLVQGKHNIFVYSNIDIDGWFSPRSHNAFYLNVGSGVWINTGWIEWLSVGGAVSVWGVNINIDDCTGDSLWVIWSYEGCLVWCTSWSAASWSWKWELLDQWNECALKCRDNEKCLYNDDIEVVDVPESSAKCTEWLVDTGNAELCINDLDSYRGVFFETSLIDSNETCPTTGQNICVYKCDSGFNLKQDPLDGNKRGCYDECKLPWDPTKKIQHGETITWYNVENAVCATDSDKSPIDTCGKHKKQLICYKWKLLLKSSNWKPISWTEATAANYKYETCMLGWYRCKTDSDNYSLYVSDITAVNWYNDTPKDATVGRIVKDRTIAKWVRWNYKLCMDYDGTPPADWKNWENCSTWDITPTPYHYKFVGCNTWDHYMLVNGVCKQQCSLTNSSGDLERYDHGKVETGFKENLVACPGECTWVQLTCDDGSWKLDGETVTWYYNYCNNGEVQCSSDFNITTDQKNSWEARWNYISCDSYDLDCNKDTKRKFVDCKAGNHQVPGKLYCEENSKYMTCEAVGKEKPPHSEYTNTTWAYHIVWSWSINGYVEEPENPCDWVCDSGYRKEGDVCVKIGDGCGDQPYTCSDPDAVITTGNNNGNGSGSIWACQGNWCAKCDENSHEAWTGSSLRCDKNVRGVCGDTAYNCEVWTKNDRNDNIGAWYTWECLWEPQDDETLKSEVCHQCNSNATWNSDTMKCECNSGFRKNWNKCVRIENTCWDIPFTCEDDHATVSNTWFINNKYSWLCEWNQCERCSEGYTPEGEDCVLSEYQICYDTTDVPSANFYVVGLVNLPFDLDIWVNTKRMCTPPPDCAAHYPAQECAIQYNNWQPHYPINSWDYSSHITIQKGRCNKNWNWWWGESSYADHIAGVYFSGDQWNVRLKGLCEDNDMIKPQCKQYDGSLFDWLEWSLYDYDNDSSSVNYILNIDEWYTGSIIAPESVDLGNCPEVGNFLNVNQSSLLDDYISSKYEQVNPGDYAYVLMPCVSDWVWYFLDLIKKEKNLPTSAYRYYEIDGITDMGDLYWDCY